MSKNILKKTKKSFGSNKNGFIFAVPKHNTIKFVLDFKGSLI